MPKIDLEKIPFKTGSGYPAPYDAEMAGRSSQRLAPAGGLTQFGVNIVYLAPGAKSSIRHWHVEQDEFIMVTQGALVLDEDGAETTLYIGDCATFPAGDPVGHCLHNRSAEPAAILVVGTNTPTETAYYTDRDMMVRVADGQFHFTRVDGRSIGGDAE